MKEAELATEDKEILCFCPLEERAKGRDLMDKTAIYGILTIGAGLITQQVFIYFSSVFQLVCNILWITE